MAEITVEEALAQLREMFPGKAVFLKDEVEWWEEDKTPCRAVVIGIDYPPSNQKTFTDDTLTDCMAQIRKWKEENNGS